MGKQGRVTHRVFAAIGMACAVIVISNVPATAMVKRLSFPEVVQRADLIFDGVVTEQRCRFGTDQNMIFTDVTFELREVISHRPDSLPLNGSSVVLSFAGGSIGEQNVAVSDVPTFVTGCRYLIFTRWDGVQYASPLIGAVQGRFQILRDESSEKLYPLAGRRVITGVNGNGLSYGVPTERIKAGKAFEAATIVPDRFFDIAPRAVGETAAKGGHAVSGLDRSSVYRPPITLDAFVAEVRQTLAQPTAEWR